MWIALALGAAFASAQGSVRWEAPPQCPTQETVVAAVERHLGSSLHDLETERWSAEATVERAADSGWQLTLVVETPDGRTERALHDPADCDAVSEAAALLIAIALDPDVAEGEQPDPATPDPEPPTTDEGQAEPDAPAAPPVTQNEDTIVADTREPETGARRRPPLLFTFAPAAGLDWGTLRGVSPTGGAQFAWRLPKVRVGVSATFGATQGFRVPAVSRELSLWMWTVAAEAGPVFSVGAFEFPLMAGLEAGQILIQPVGIVTPDRQQLRWAALLVTPGVAWVPLRWLAVVARVSAVVSFVRPSFEIPGITRIHAPAPAGIRASLGLEFRFSLGAMKSRPTGNKQGPR